MLFRSVSQSRYGLVERISDSDDMKLIQNTMSESITNFTQSVVDDTIRTNAEFHSKLGLKPKIRRTSTGKCCEWCQQVVGVYDYQEVKETNNDVFRRHRYCRCEVDYDPGDGRKQNVHTKRWENYEEKYKIETRKNFEVSNMKNKLKNISIAKELGYSPIP